MCEQHLTDEEREARPKGPAAFVDELVVAMTNCRIYSREHPRVAAALQSLTHTFRDLSHAVEGGRVELGAADGFLFFDRRPLLGATLSSRRLIEPLEALESGGLAFDATATQDDLHLLASYMSKGCKGADHYTDANAALAELGCTTIHFLAPYRNADGSWEDEDHEDVATFGSEIESDVLETRLHMNVNKELYQDVVHVLQDAMVKSCRGEALDTGDASGFVESILTQLQKDSKGMMSIARYEKYDAFTFGHSIRVCFIALNFARHLTSDPRLLQRIGLAALMHDIGKAWVPFEVLHSHGRLTASERREMIMHTLYGGQILLSSHNPDPLSVAVAFSHHLDTQGGGYPQAIRSNRQSAATMIVKLSDVYEALTAVRPYKPRMSPTRAYRIMISMGNHFEPSLLRKFIAVNGVYPVGSRVRLSTGDIGRVECQTSSLLEPVVTTELDVSGEALFSEDVRHVDLSRPLDGKKVRVDELLLEAEM
jgi:HD-GYP domain-containing protein (c-di-GMP phosphodiesterase class II)